MRRLFRPQVKNGLEYLPDLFRPCSDIPDNPDPRERGTEISVPKKEMLFIRDSLVSAESSRRRGDTATVYKAYNR